MEKKNQRRIKHQEERHDIPVPAFPKTTWASMERLILLEQTTPYESSDGSRCASGGGKPGGVDGRGSVAILLNVKLSR